MTTLLWSIVLFIVGAIEFAIDQYEKLVSVRLKFSQTMWLGVLNQWFDFVMNIFLFGILISFWENWHSGIHDFAKLWMYFSYINGRVVGTGAAVWIYNKSKKKRDREKYLKWLEKGRQKQKKLRAINKDISSTVEVTEVEPLFDTIETSDLKEEITARVIENTAKQISDKIDAALGNVNEEQDANKETDNNNS